MKALFLHFFDFSPHSGISKKILYQIKALEECGFDVELSFMTIDDNGYQKRICGDTIVDNYGNGFMAKILKWFKYKSLTEYILVNKFDFIYIRSFYNTTPSLLHMLKILKENEIKIVMEIPTYPYDYEVRKSPLQHKIIFWINKLYRHGLKKYLTKIVTFSDFKEIHGVKTINISNGIDFSSIKEKSGDIKMGDKFNLIGVADIRFWHGFDRVVCGLRDYYKTNHDVVVNFDIVGDGFDANKLKQLAKDLNMEKYVHFRGNCSGEELDMLFEKSDFGIASLGRHRSGITNIKTLKNREYAARGIPFIYSETDEDFENMPYIIKAPADETPINIQGIIDFYKSLKLTHSDIRGSIVDVLSWKVQMQKVVNETFSYY